ncbi:uncharacterized protein LOC108950458 [Ciona intestinalis]
MVRLELCYVFFSLLFWFDEIDCQHRVFRVIAKYDSTKFIFVRDEHPAPGGRKFDKANKTCGKLFGTKLAVVSTNDDWMDLKMSYFSQFGIDDIWIGHRCHGGIPVPTLARGVGPNPPCSQDDLCIRAHKDKIETESCTTRKYFACNAKNSSLGKTLTLNYVLGKKSNLYYSTLCYYTLLCYSVNFLTAGKLDTTLGKDKIKTVADSTSLINSLSNLEESLLQLALIPDNDLKTNLSVIVKAYNDTGVFLKSNSSNPLMSFGEVGLERISLVNRSESMQIGLVLGKFHVSPKIIDDIKNGSNQCQDETCEFVTPFDPVLTMISMVDSEGNKLNDSQVEFAISQKPQSNNFDAIFAKLSNKAKGGKFRITEVNQHCNYIDPRTNKFSEYGCVTLASKNGSFLRCHCNHTTVFAVLLSVTATVVPQGVKITSYVTEGLSVICLIVTIIILLALKHAIPGNRVFFQINLSVSLLFLHFSNLMHDLAVFNEISCIVLTCATHYFLLVTACWLLAEGMTLAIKTSNHAMQYDGEHKRSNRWFFAFGWGVPVIFAGFAIVYGLITGTYLKESLPFKEGIVTSSKYKYERCWLIPQTTIFWSTVIGPTAFILTVNLLILLRVSRFVYLMHVNEVRMRPSQPREGAREVFQQLKRTMRLIVVLVFTLGMPLAIGYLVGIYIRTGIGYTATVFMYINVVVNGLQGVIVFIVYLVAVKEIRQTVSRKVAQSLEMTELFRSN